MNGICRSLVLLAVIALAGCVGYGLPGSYGYPGGSGYPSGNPDYGYPGNGNYNGGRFRCESQDNRTRHCRADTRGGVRIVRQLSDSPCIQGRSWGYDNNGVWVSRGCRAEFVAGAGGSYGPGYGTNPGYGRTLRCESRNNRQQRCNVRVTRGVDLIRQLSKTRCVRGQNWGWDRSGIWVQGGCRGEFSVR